MPVANVSSEPAHERGPSPSIPSPSLAGVERAPVRSAAALPNVGELWENLYRIDGVVSEPGGMQRWHGVRVESGEAVILRAVPVVAGDDRSRAWERLVALDLPGVMRTHGSISVGTLRVEIGAAPTGVPLADWSKLNPIDLPLIESVLRAVAAVLDGLHQHGIVHLGIGTQSIFVDDKGGRPAFVVGGLERATFFNQTGLVSVEVDPFVAPPEAAGLFQHSPGASLCAWDWWMLGRTLQTIMLGRPAMGLLLKKDITRRTPELLARAEAVLMEREPGAPRAGAVELMPAMEPRVDQLLRGLLTSAGEARWRGDAVARWLNGETGPHYYSLSRNEKLFRWQDHAYTVAEAADLLRSVENWPRAIEHVWDTGQPGTLAHFLAEESGHRGHHDRLEELREVASAFALKAFPPDVVREVIAAVALLELAGANLVWRGQMIGVSGLEKAFSREENDPIFVAQLGAFSVRPVIMLIEKSDLSAARALSEFSQAAATAEALARQNRWLKDADIAARARLLRVALKPLGELRAAAQVLHERFACSTEKPAETLFNLPHPSRGQLVALVWVGEQGAQRGFLTHAEWTEREVARLRLAAGKEADALGWLSLSRALRAGPWLFGRWRFVIPGWIGLAMLTSALWPGPAGVVFAAAPLLLGCVARLAANRWLNFKLRRVFPDAESWGVAAGAARCQAELGAYGARCTLKKVRLELERLNDEIAKLDPAAGAKERIRVRSRFLDAWGMSVVSGLALVAGLTVGGMRAKAHPPHWDTIVAAWMPNAGKGGPKTSGAAAGAVREAGSGGAEDKSTDGEVKISWPFKAGDAAQVLTVKESMEARPDQLRSMNERAAKFVRPYKPETIKTLMLLRVPTESRFGVMLYDGQRREVVNTRVYMLDYLPFPRSWVEVGGRQAIYLPE